MRSGRVDNPVSPPRTQLPQHQATKISVLLFSKSLKLQGAKISCSLPSFSPRTCIIWHCCCLETLFGDNLQLFSTALSRKKKRWPLWIQIIVSSISSDNMFLGTNTKHHFQAYNQTFYNVNANWTRPYHIFQNNFLEWLLVLVTQTWNFPFVKSKVVNRNSGQGGGQSKMEGV